MGNHNFPCVKVEPNVGWRITDILNAGESAAIPTLVSGVKPKFLWVRVYGGASTNVVFFSPMHSLASPSTTTGIPLSPLDTEGLVVDVTGFSDFGVSATGDQLSEIQVVPLADF